MAHKLALVIALLLGCSLPASAQETIYLGADSLPCSLADARFKLVVQPIDSTSYYLEFRDLITEKVCLEGPSRTKSLAGRNGVWKEYFYNDSLRQIAEYSSGLLSGACVNFHPDGVKFAEGQYMEGKMNGIWKWYHSNNQLASNEIWAMDSLVQTLEFFEPDGRLSPRPWLNFIEPIALNHKEVTKGLVYPKKAKKEKSEGIVQIKIFLNDKGELIRAIALNSIHPDIDALALKAVREIKFTPGIHHNIPISVWVTVPIRFKLNR